jgi:hypothetical protein
MSTDARICNSRKLAVVVAALLGAGDAGCERPIDSASALSGPRVPELWRFIRCRVNPSAGSLCTSPTERCIERGMLGEGNPAVYFFPAGRQVLQGEGSLYDAAQRLCEKKFTILRNGSDDSDVLFLEH